MHFIEGIGRVTGEHPQIWSKFLHQSFDDTASVGRVRDSDAFGGHFLYLCFCVALEIEPHDAFKLQVLYVTERRGREGVSESVSQ